MLTTPEVRSHAPTTTAQVLVLVGEFGPTVEGGALVFDLDPPADPLPLLRVLHTGIRAALIGRSWYGCGTDRKTAAAKLLDRRSLIPPDVWLLAVEGDERWDRIRPDARLDLASLFAPAG